MLEWRLLDFAVNVVCLEETEWQHLKTDDSAAKITADPEMLAELRRLMPKPGEAHAAWSQFALVGHRPPRPESPQMYCCCETT